MSLVEEFIQKVPANERADAKRYISTLYEVFEILEKKGYLRPNLREHAERTRFVDIMKTSNKLFSAYNMLFNVFVERGNSKKFVEHNKEKFGFNEDDTAHLLLSESIATFLRNAELFKNCFLFSLKTSKTFWPKITLGPLMVRLDKVTNGKSKPLTKDIDTELRNALAHGLFWLESSMLIYYKDSTLKERKEIIITELWTKGRKHSFIAQCLIHLIADWYIAT